VGVEEEGESEGRSVMERIGVYAPRASGLTSLWCLVTRESAKPTEEAKQMTAMISWCGFPLQGASAAEGYREGRVETPYRVLQRAFRDA
jgi:hypothetical protein